jgi:hypothetical protein
MLVLGARMFGSLKMGLLLGLIVGAVATVVSHFLIERLSSSGVNLLYGKRKPIYTVTEKFEGPLNQARHLKSKQDYLNAFKITDEVLNKVPKLPEALYLKAQILWEGYHDAAAAREVLEKILELVPDAKETYHRWAQSLLLEISNHSRGKYGKSKGT